MFKAGLLFLKIINKYKFQRIICFSVHVYISINITVRNRNSHNNKIVVLRTSAWAFDKERCLAVQIHARLENVYSNYVIDVSNVHPLVQKFRDGETKTKGKQRNAGPSTSVSVNNRLRADELLQKKRHFFSITTANSLQIRII